MSKQVKGGVAYCARKKRYYVRLWVDKKGIHLGYYKDWKEATFVYNVAEHLIRGNSSTLESVVDKFRQTEIIKIIKDTLISYNLISQS